MGLREGGGDFELRSANVYVHEGAYAGAVVLPSKKEGWSRGNTAEGCKARRHPMSNWRHPRAKISVGRTREPVMAVWADAQDGAGDGPREEISRVWTNMKPIPF